MTDLAAVLILAAAGVAGLLLIPFGLPGLWVIVLGIVIYGWLTDFRSLPVWLVGLAIDWPSWANCSRRGSASALRSDTAGRAEPGGARSSAG